MKLKLSQIVEARDALTRLASEKYPANIAYRIQRNLRAIDPELNEYNKAREDLIKNKYGVEVDAEKAPGAYRVPPEKVAEFNAEINLLLDEEIDLNIMTVSLDFLHEITPLDLMVLEWMFDEPQPVTEEQPAGTHKHIDRARAGRNGKTAVSD